MPSKKLSSRAGSEIPDSVMVYGETLLQEMIIKIRLKIIVLMINRFY